MTDSFKPPLVLEPRIGVSLENPDVVRGVKIFEERNALIDRAVALHFRISSLVDKFNISQKIKDFLDMNFSEVYHELDTTVIRIFPQGESTVRRLSIMRQEIDPAKHEQTYFLPAQYSAALFNNEKRLITEVEAHNKKTLFTRLKSSDDLENQVIAHNKSATSYVDATKDQIVSFLATAETHWPGGAFEKMSRKLLEIEDFVGLVEIVAKHLTDENEDVTPAKPVLAFEHLDLEQRVPHVHVQKPSIKKENPVIRALALQCELSLYDYVTEPTVIKLEAATRLVSELSGIAATKPEEVVRLVYEWKLRIDRDEGDATSAIRARQVINPKAVLPEIANKIKKLQETANEAREWLFGVAQKIEQGEVDIDLYYQVLKLLKSQEQMKSDSHIAAFYAAVASLQNLHEDASATAYKTLERAKHVLSNGFENSDGIIEEEATRLGLKKYHVRENVIAQKLIERLRSPVSSGGFKHVRDFCHEWRLKILGVEPPSEKFLEAFMNNDIVGDFDRTRGVGFSDFVFHYDKPVTLFVQTIPLSPHDESPLIKALRIKNGDGKIAVSSAGITRNSIDTALWVQTPKGREKTASHIKVIKQLGLDPKHYNFRHISYDEYLRLVGQDNIFERRGLSVWFDGYWVTYDRIGRHYISGLCGNSSLISGADLEKPNFKTVVQLVLERVR